MENMEQTSRTFTADSQNREDASHVEIWYRPPLRFRMRAITLPVKSAEPLPMHVNIYRVSGGMSQSRADRLAEELAEWTGSTPPG